MIPKDVEASTRTVIKDRPVASHALTTNHPTATRRRGLLYQFTPKHHGADLDQGTWAEDVSDDDELSIFDDADDLEIDDENGNLYGVFRLPEEELRELGRFREQVAEFPA